MWFKSKQEKVHQFKRDRLPESDEDFVHGCALSVEDVYVAIGVRRVIARLGDVEPAYIHHNDCFDGDIDLLPFWDSLDSLGIVMEIEEEFGVKLNDDAAQRIRNPEMVRGLRVKDFVGDVANVVRQL